MNNENVNTPMIELKVLGSDNLFYEVDIFDDVDSLDNINFSELGLNICTQDIQEEYRLGNYNII